MTTPFTFDKNYDNNEQVRPFYAAYSTVRAELEAAGQYPYNDSFKGRIPGIEGPSEDTAIYLLQTMHDLDDMREKVAAFGGVDAATLPVGETWRGDVAKYGWYMGGTGWQVYKDHRIERNSRGDVLLTAPRKRNGFYALGSVLFREAGA